MKKFKKLLAFGIACGLILLAGCSIGSANELSTPISNLSIPSDELEKELSESDLAQQEAFSNSTPENDTDVGLRNIKIDTAERNLTDAQKTVLQYFDEDYLDIPNYEFLRRYPSVFQGAQLAVYGTVKKILSVNDSTYKLVLWLDVSPQMLSYADETNAGEYIILTGKIGSSVYMENDTILGYGRYIGLETIEIDGISYTIPSVSMMSSYYAEVSHVALRSAIKHDYYTVKTVAEAIFGSDIEVREVEVGTDISEDMGMVFATFYQSPPMLLVELENQSNANFKKFIFRTDQGVIIDAKDPLSHDSVITRNIEFSADFEHFFLFTHNTSLGSLTLAYYDKDFHKIWEREFEETTNAVYDYTKNNLYIVVNNQLYIINIETGEDTFAPNYVGAKADIRKMADGILMVSESKSDGIMKCQLNGNIVWMTNLETDVVSVGGLQLVDENIVIQYEDSAYEQHYMLLNAETGAVLVNANTMG